MNKTSLKQKFLLIAFSIFLTLVFLEIGLRAAGAIVLYLQDRHNHLSYAQNEYRILCLGESTTALGGEDSYPSQLGVMLNAKGAGRKYTVINKGVVSTTSNYILAHIERNLDIYKPRMVVIMMGINDKAYLHDFTRSLWWENARSYAESFRVYKLFYLLYEHISHRIKEANEPHEAVDQPNEDGGAQHLENFLKVVIAECLQKFHDHMAAALHFERAQQFDQSRQEQQYARQSVEQASLACVELARRYRLQGNFQEAQKVLAQAALFNTSQPEIYQEWGELYLAQGQSAQAVKAFKAALYWDPRNNDVILGMARAYYQLHNDEAFLLYSLYLQRKPNDYWGYIELAQWLRVNKHYEQAMDYLNHAMAIQPVFEQAYVDLGQVLDEESEYQKEEAFYLKEIPLNPKRLRLYQALGEFYQKHGKTALAREYFQKAAARQMPEYCPATLVNYSLLLDKILSRHIKVIVMQYPLRDIDPLKNYLGPKNGVIFVENKQNFKEALPNGGFWHYFKDNFAYDFGHCTRAGNGLIAGNLTEIILKGLHSRGDFWGSGP